MNKRLALASMLAGSLMTGAAYAALSVGASFNGA